MKDKAEAPAASVPLTPEQEAHFLVEQCCSDDGAQACWACIAEALGAAEARGRAEGLGVLRTMVGALMRIESPPWSVSTMDPETLCRWMQRQAALAVQIGGPAVALASETAATAAPEAVAIPASSVGTKG